MEAVREDGSIDLRGSNLRDADLSGVNVTVGNVAVKVAS
jgi:hypothetical protein